MIEVNARMGGARIHQMVEAALAELTLSGKNLRHARRRAAQVLRDPPRILPG